MLDWLVPTSLFWPVAAVVLGGMPVEIQGGGGVRQLLGLLVSFALYLLVWWGVRAGLSSPLGPTGALVAASLVATLLLPVWCRIGYLVLGMKLRGPLFKGARELYPS